MILVTAYTDFEFARKALRYGAVDFVVKKRHYHRSSKGGEKSGVAV